MLLCKHGLRPRRHLWFFRKRALFSLITRTRFTANFSISLTPSDETMDDCVVGARTGCLTILECGACTEFMLSLAARYFLWLYWTGWEISTALHGVHEDHGWVGESTVDAWRCCVPLSLSDTSSAISTTRVWKVEEEKEHSNVSQSMRNGSLLYLISIHKVFDFMHTSIIICIGLYAYALHNMHIHLIICIIFYLHIRFWISICICIFVFAYALLCAYALYAMSQP